MRGTTGGKEAGRERGFILPSIRDYFLESNLSEVDLLRSLPDNHIISVGSFTLIGTCVIVDVPMKYTSDTKVRSEADDKVRSAYSSANTADASKLGRACARVFTTSRSDSET